MKFLPQTFFLCHNLKTGGIAVGWLGVFVCLPSWWFVTKIVASSKPDPRVDILVGGTIGGILSLVVNALLVYGSKKDSWRFLVPWLAYAIIETLVVLSSYIMNIINHPDPIVLLVITVFQVVYIYCWICVFSLGKNLYESSTSGKTQLQGHQENELVYDDVA